MYDRRLNMWRVTKNMSSEKKQRMINMLVETGTWTNDASPSKARHVSIDHKDFNKVVRHAKAQNRQRLCRPISLSLTSSEARRREIKRANSCDSNSSPFASGTTTKTSTTPRSDLDAFTEGFESQTFACSDSDDNEGFENATESNPIFLPVALNQHSGAINVEKMLKNVRIYLDRCSSSKRSVEPSFIDKEGFEIVCPSDTFWNELKHGIYLLKVKSPGLAWPALDKACDLAPAVMTSRMPADHAFLRELFLTLSPVNTRIFPKIRIVLLQYLSYLACFKLQSTHPLAVICHELQQDQHSREVSELALKCMLSILRAPGSGSNRDETAAFRLECANITLLRRDGQLSLAAAEAKLLYDRCRWNFQHDDSEQATQQLRKAAAELAHVRMDQRGEHYVEAIDLSLLVLTGMLEPTVAIGGDFPPHPSDFASFIGDEKSVYALEDLAKIYEELDATDQAIEWLERAEDFACELFGNETVSTATAHIVKKLADLKARSSLQKKNYWTMSARMAPLHMLSLA